MAEGPYPPDELKRVFDEYFARGNEAVVNDLIEHNPELFDHFTAQRKERRDKETRATFEED